ncbi:hypothetical protein BIW11_02910 [Tropilaelaps mercedesae]|uniref:Uncharacterized protein n=1 Tax=Tropilaelaps mercedesae TaxID=418985 RepID=A0A1V9XVN3_9ACAR|nr:hypothetical protein BIW11_02910 [Tropilaelaps mercedesae]
MANPVEFDEAERRHAMTFSCKRMWNCNGKLICVDSGEKLEDVEEAGQTAEYRTVVMCRFCVRNPLVETDYLCILFSARTLLHFTLAVVGFSQGLFVSYSDDGGDC